MDPRSGGWGKNVKQFVLWIALILGLCTGSAIAQGQAEKLSGEQIRAVLTGNTALGRWDGVPYRRFFGPDGVTVWAQKDAQPVERTWRVDDRTQEYQSQRSGDLDWEGWFVMDYGRTLYWVSHSTPPTPFHVVPGKQLDFE